MYYMQCTRMALFMHNVICIMVSESNPRKGLLLIDPFKI